MNLKSLYSGSNMDHFEKQAVVRPDTLVCTSCGATRKHGKQPGSGWMTFILLLLAIVPGLIYSTSLLLFGMIPGLIYSIWRNSHSAMCHSCDGKLIEIATRAQDSGRSALTTDRRTMPNHVNRGMKNARRASTPPVEKIRAARKAAELSQAEAAQIVHHSLRAWQYWEDDSTQGNRRMPAAAFELFMLKTRQLELDEAIGGKY